MRPGLTLCCFRAPKVHTGLARLSGSLARLGQVREPRAAWPREVPPAFALRQGHEQVGQGDVLAESPHQAIRAVASGPIATLALDADDVQGKLAERK